MVVSYICRYLCLRTVPKKFKIFPLPLWWKHNIKTLWWRNIIQNLTNISSENIKCIPALSPSYRQMYLRSMPYLYGEPSINMIDIDSDPAMNFMNKRNVFLFEKLSLYAPLCCKKCTQFQAQFILCSLRVNRFIYLFPPYWCQGITWKLF